MKWLVLLGGNVIGFLLIKYSRELVKLFGQVPWAERKLGPGGSLLMWKIIGIVAIVFSLLYFTGQTSIFGDFFASVFSGAKELE